MSLRLAISTVRGSLHRVVRRYSDHSQTDLLNYQAPAAALFGKGSFGTLANMRAGGPATMPGVRHRCDNTFEAVFPIQATVPDQGFPPSLGTRRSLTIWKKEKRK
jgi:hypothetical protein